MNLLAHLALAFWMFLQGIPFPGPVLPPIAGGSSPTLVAHVKWTIAGAGNSATSTAANMTGSKLITVESMSFGAPGYVCTAGNVSDSSGNTWALVHQYYQTATPGGDLCIWYATNPTVAASQTFTCANSYYSICLAQGWGGIATSAPLDVYNGNSALTTSSTAPWTTNSVTPTNTDLCIAAGNGYYGGAETSWSAGSGYTTIDSYISSGGNYTGGLAAYDVTGAAANGSITPGGEADASADSAGAIACFLP